ncbi:MAG: TMEM165/GDT1 family protein [Spirochaetales bacterium]|nr:TMEM165/GDT1 family protein [Spirochaetales bacterium]
MDIGIIFASFALVFLAELGDKTQLVALSLTSTSKNPFSVFLATSLALTLSTIIAALLGGLASRFVPSFTAYITGILFLIFGGIIIFAKEMPKIKECFLEAVALENAFIRYVPRVFEKAGKLDYQIINILRQEKSHAEVFKILIKEKKLFKDDINKLEELDHITKSLSFPKKILTSPFPIALNEIVRQEKIGLEVFKLIHKHIKEEEHHQEDELMHLLEDLIHEEEEHIRIFLTYGNEASNEK